jgi:hypothetical protein
MHLSDKPPVQEFTLLLLSLQALQRAQRFDAKCLALRFENSGWSQLFPIVNRLIIVIIVPLQCHQISPRMQMLQFCDIFLTLNKPRQNKSFKQTT